MYSQIINSISNFLKTIISSNNLMKIQRSLIQVNIYVKAEELITIILLISGFIFLVDLIIILLFNSSFFILLSVFLPSIFIINYVLYKKEHRKEDIETDLPDYLHQISSLLNIGLGFESALFELSKTTKSPLNTEIKRVLLEVHLGKPFNNALIDMAERIDSNNLKYVFQIIIHTRESGGNLADILDDISIDLKDTILLKKERKASVMMSVMFLLISSIIATPFALGMIGLYSEFIEYIGKYNSLINTIPIASIGYIGIHSILVSFLLAIVLHSNYKKGVKYLFILVPASLIVYYISKSIFRSILGLGA